MKVSPAPAGMIPDAAHEPDKKPGEPRTRGDDPTKGHILRLRDV